ncbi:uncharacterized protein LOC126910472 [Daktulosphaira vitifoliae]|uniref:uncharacterized protein LOC126910472 n=1 Tax=Daktulosphaira vitifoliae TaxID=58002 RepID=UPI0021A9F189|nr:uncharacterized protein LOC126910472 [Daktulosphaira vitifoliae]
MYSETYLLHFLIENIPYIPLWSRVITAKIGLEKRQSNATAESWFNIIKNHVLGNQRKMKCGRFIEKTSARVTAIWSRCGLIIPKNVLAIRPKNNANNDDELHLNDKEFWLKKGKKPSNLVNLGTILRPQKSMNTFKNTKSISENDKTNEVLNRKFVSEVSVQKDIEPSEDIGNAHYSSIEILNVDCINETLDLVEKYKNDDTNKDSSVISYGHTVVWEPSGDESPVGKYKMYRTSNLIKDGLYYMHGYPGCKNYIVARMSFGNETVEISSEDFKHLDTKGENNELWLENKEIWCLLQICLKRSERTWVKQKQQMLGCMSPDISYYMINLGKRIEPPNENGKIEDQLMTNKIIMNKFNPNDYRKKLQNLILSNSECMKNNCLICGVDEGSFNEKSKKIDKRSGEMVQCESCTRWLHINCLPKKDPLPDNDIKWICGLCSANGI